MSSYDIIIVGAGSGGLSVGLFMAKLELKVLMIDRNAGRIGGECLNDGCIPSKALIHIAGLIGKAKQRAEFGISATGRADMTAIGNYIRTRQNIIRKHEDAAYLKHLGIDFVAGEAAFENKKAIRVGNEMFTAPKIVLATGSTPVTIDVPGLEQIPVFNNETIFNLKTVPEHLAIIGGGATGLEIGQAFQRLGSQVTVIEEKDGILGSALPSISAQLRKKMEEEGIVFQTGSKVISGTPDGTLEIEAANGIKRDIKCDGVFVAMGRTFDFGPLRLDKGGIKTKAGKIILDERLRTTNKRVWVCGDVAGSLMFSHAAEQHARLLLNNFFSPFKKVLDNDQMSWAVFTDPEVTAFGLSEQQLNERHLRFERLSHDFTADDRAVTDNYQFGQLHLYLSKTSLFKKQVILGGAMLSPNAGEMTQELILAMNTKMSVLEILKKIYPYPVASRVNQAIIAGYKSKQLTPMVKRLLRWSYRFI